MSSIQVHVTSELHDAEAHKCALRATSTADTPVGPYANEYAIFVTFTEDGKQITKFEEFVDSACAGQFFAKLNEWAAAQKKGSD